jgi:glutamate-1-semialdehyde 2,1-aminomutase
MKNIVSKELFRRASERIPGGVNSPVRAFKAVGGTPLFIESGKGCKIKDADGNEFIDFVCSWGPLILGHAHPKVLEAIHEKSLAGTTFGAPTRIEVELAEAIQYAMPSMQMLRLVSSGTEATMSALRAARGYTGKNNIIKFEGCYHGHHDSLLTSAGSGVATFDLPDSAGVPGNYSHHTISVVYNSMESIQRLPDAVLQDTAAVIIEPVAANMGLVLPQRDFLRNLRKFTSERNILLIFDEVITGFRVSYGGAQEYYGVQPDMTCLGKIAGGGMPLAAYGGRAEIMRSIAPLGPVYQAGTLSGNPIAAAAGRATLKILQGPSVYEDLERRSAAFFDTLRQKINGKGISLATLGSMFTVFFRNEPPQNFTEAKECDTTRYADFFWKMLEQGIYLAPSQFETNFISLAHQEQDLEQALQAFEKVL